MTRRWFAEQFDERMRDEAKEREEKSKLLNHGYSDEFIKDEDNLNELDNYSSMADDLVGKK